MNETVPDGIGSAGLVRTRIGVLLVGYVVIGVAAAGIFDTVEWSLIVAPVFPAVASALLVARSWALRLLGATAAVAIALVLAVAVSGGTTGDITEALTSGIQGLLSTEWPSPTQPDLVGICAAVIAAGCAISCELAAHKRFHLLPLLPLLLTYIAVVALSAPLGVDWWSLVLIALTATLFAALRNDGTLGDRLVLLRGERRLVPLLAIALVLAALTTVPVSLSARADPRRNDPAEQTAPLLDPIEATLALRSIDPPIDLHVISSRSGDVLPTQWRTAALENYDGRRWSPNLTLRPIGTTLGPATGPIIDAGVRFVDDSLRLVPLSGDPISVDAPVETDTDRTVVRLLDRPDPATEIPVVANLTPAPSDAVESGYATRIVDDSTSGLTDLALGLAGDGAPVDQLAGLETTMREEFVLDSDVQGGGLQQALIDRFLRDTQRGTSEQFATAYVLLARSLGVEARVATGFIAEEAPSPGDDLILDSSQAAVWPEVQLNDGRWVALDPVPDEEASDGAPPPPEPQVQTPAAPQPPIAPPPEPENETTTQDEIATTATDSTLSSVLQWTVQGALGLFIFAFPFIVAAAIILGLKHRRRRRRLRAALSTERIRGAWASATDALVDAGLGIDGSDTDVDISVHGEPLVGGAYGELRRLALLSSAATFGDPEHPHLLADDATTCLDHVETSIADQRTRWQRIRWRLSLRSFRRATRSPVTI